MSENAFDFQDFEDDFSNAEIEAYKAEIEAKRNKVAELKKNVATGQLEMEKLSAEMRRIRREADDAINQLSIQRSAIDNINFTIRKEIRDLEAEIRALEQRLALAIENAKQTDKFRMAATKFDDITRNAPWREWAFDYQMDGARIMATNERTIQADKMGLGKSIQSLMACDMLQSEKIIIMCPATLVNNFIRELAKWAPHRIPIRLDRMSKTDRYASIDLAKMIGGPVVMVVNYEAWRKDNLLLDKLVSMKFDTAILDEFHFVKNPKSNAARGVERVVLANNICPICKSDTVEERSGIFYWTRCSECVWNVRENNGTRWDAAGRRSIKYVFPMSGTPVLNRPDELYFGLHLILPSIFYDVEIFRGMFCIMEEGKWRWAWGGLDRLEKHLAGHYLSRNKKDVGINLPPQTPQIMELEFNEEEYTEQQSIINMIKESAQISLSNGAHFSMTETIAILMRLRQANVCPAGIEIWEKFYEDEDSPKKVTRKELILRVRDETTESIKLDAATELIRDVTADGSKKLGERVVVFSQFKAPLHELHKRLTDAGISSIVMDGDTNQITRSTIELDFDRTSCSEDEYTSQVLLTNYRTGGTGLNLTAATQVVILDEPWNPGTFDQALQRVDRIGQTKSSTVTIIRIKSTVDEWLAELLEEKADLVGQFESRGREVTQSLLEALQNGSI